MNDVNDELKIQAYKDGIIISFKLLSLPDFQFRALMECIKRNKDRNRIRVYDTRLDKNNIFFICIGEIDGYIPDFIQLLECEMLTVIPIVCTTIKESLSDKIQKEFDTLVGELPDSTKIAQITPITPITP